MSVANSEDLANAIISAALKRVIPKMISASNSEVDKTVPNASDNGDDDHTLQEVSFKIICFVTFTK